MAMPIKVGCCGWGFFSGGLRAYARKFALVEVQQTFYKLPMLKTAQRWRAEVPKDFEFTLKAWQAITHLPTSPTWRRSGLQVTEAQRDKYGWLRPTRENFEAWRRTKEICDALEAKVCVIQCPPNFKCSSENIVNMRKFFSKIDRGKLALAWEPRGDWREHPDEIERLCGELELVHVVDLMRREPVSKHSIAYIRLHGLNPREYDYNYRYSVTELKQLATKAKALAEKHREIYIMFNNYFMYDNAPQLAKMLKV
ncbi:MAG: DUF72 domain-containing protein [Candidatus Hodarchaeaceae archaeon]|nr:DUF72 domain-containing protein [Candidatus Hodarchaeaceae archaeon]